MEVVSEFVKVASTKDVPEGEGIVVQANGSEIALFNVAGEFYAIHNVCRHAGGSLGDGFLEGDIVACPIHGWQYNVKNGACLIAPSISVKSYQVKVAGSDIFIAKT